MCDERKDFPVANVRDYRSAEVLNREFPKWLYVGRKVGVWEQSPLANPFKLRQGATAGDRKVVIEKYRRWLWNKIQVGDPAVLSGLREINRKTVLVCWCAPDPCHAEVVHRAAAWLREQR